MLITVRFTYKFVLQYVETTADELETKDGLLSGCGGGGGDPAASIVGRAQQFYSLLTSSLEASCNDLKEVDTLKFVGTKSSNWDTDTLKCP